MELTASSFLDPFRMYFARLMVERKERRAVPVLAKYDPYYIAFNLKGSLTAGGKSPRLERQLMNSIDPYFSVLLQISPESRIDTSLPALLLHVAAQNTSKKFYVCGDIGLLRRIIECDRLSSTFDNLGVDFSEQGYKHIIDHRVLRLGPEVY